MGEDTSVKDRNRSHTFAALCKALGKGPRYVRSLQVNLGLPKPAGGQGFSDAYVNFLEKVVALRAFNVPMRDIADLFQKERRILEILHFDTLTSSQTWFLDACTKPGHSETRLLLSGHDLGFPLRARAIQANLNFHGPNGELFSSAEMGEDARKALDRYLALLGEVEVRVQAETYVLENALAWSAGVFGPA